jgi:cyanophycin synthetase
MLADDTGQHALLHAASMPVAIHGHARHNVANALAAAAALTAAGHSRELVASALAGFTSDAKHNPLRCNLFDVRGVTVIVDYAHNTVACKALVAMARSMLQIPGGRVSGVVTAPGDRRASDLFDVGGVFGAGLDDLTVYESNRRGRGSGETSRIMLDGARSAAPAGRPLRVEPDVRDALALALKRCRKGDILVFTCPDTLEHLVEAVRRTDPECATRIAREAQQGSDDQPIDLIRRADMARYQAKADAQDCRPSSSSRSQSASSGEK